jgi:hypothetical protein
LNSVVAGKKRDKRKAPLSIFIEGAHYTLADLFCPYGPPIEEHFIEKYCTNTLVEV